MELSEHFILESEIVGIGPLLIQRSKDSAVASLFNPRKLLYVVHLRHQSITIESSWFDLGGLPNEVMEKNRKSLDEWKAGYETAKVKILDLLKYGKDT